MGSFAALRMSAWASVGLMGSFAALRMSGGSGFLGSPFEGELSRLPLP